MLIFLIKNFFSCFFKAHAVPWFCLLGQGSDDNAEMCGVVERMLEIRLIRSQAHIYYLLVVECWAHPVNPKSQFPQL